MPIKVLARIRDGFDKSCGKSLLRLSNSNVHYNLSPMVSPTLQRIRWEYDGSCWTLKVKMRYIYIELIGKFGKVSELPMAA